MARRARFVAVAMAWVAAAGAWASSSNPPDFYPGKQGMASCLTCHNTFQGFGGPGHARLDGAPTAYVPGEVYTMSVKVRQPGAKSFGFQLYAVDAQGQQAGAILTDDIKQDVRQARGVTFLKNSFHGADAADEQSWTFQWRAPREGGARVGFYAEAVAADGLDEVGNDHVYQLEAVSEPAAPAESD